MVRQTTKVIFFEILGVLSLVLMAAIGILAFMLASGPVELGIFRDDVERALTNARDGRTVTVERLTLQWSPSERRMFVVADSLSLKDAAGEEAGFANKAELTLDAGAILLGKVEVLEADLRKGWIEVENVGPNRWTVAGDPMPEIRAGVLPQTPQEWLDRTNGVLTDVLVGLEAFSQTLEFEGLEFNNFDLRIVAEDGSAIGSIEAASGQFQKLENDVSIQFAGDGQGLGLPEIFGVSLDTYEGYQSLKAVLDVGVLPIADLASRFGLQGLEESDLRLGTSFNAELARSEGLQQVGLVASRDDGTFSLGDWAGEISDITTSLVYLPTEDQVRIDFLQFASGRLNGRFEGEVSNVLATNALRRVALQSEEMTLDLTGLFEAPSDIRNLELEADLSDDFTIIAVQSLEADIDTTRLQASGEFDWSVEHEEGELPFTLDVTAELVGDISKETILAYWPVNLGRGARNYVSDQLLSGNATEATAVISIKPDSMAEGYLREEDLAVTFAFEGGSLRFLSDMPPVENVVGTGRVGGNSLDINVIRASYDDWAIQSGGVEFPAFNPRGESFIVTAYGAGPAVSVLRHLSNSRLRLQETTGFDPERVSGDATASFKLTRPALSDVPLEDHIMEVKGQIRNAGLTAAAGPFDIAEGNVNVDVTLDRMILTGFGNLGSSPIQFTWRDAFDDEGAPAD